MADEAPKKRGRGRPKGSKNKKQPGEVKINKAPEKKASSVPKIKEEKKPEPKNKGNNISAKTRAVAAKGDAVVISADQDRDDNPDSYHIVIVEGEAKKVKDSDNPDLY